MAVLRCDKDAELYERVDWICCAYLFKTFVLSCISSRVSSCLLATSVS